MPAQVRRRNTGARIAEELSRATKPMTAYDLLDRLRPSGVFAPTTIYRALDKLLSMGKVHRIESLNAFVACRGSEGGSHEHDHGNARFGVGFTICDRCSAVTEFVDPSLQARIEGVAAVTSFRPRSSMVEIHGLCAACAGEDGPQP